MKTANRELLDRLAAEYVLGTLRGRARSRFERWLLSPQVGALVNTWEHRLAGLDAPAGRVAPPAAVWRKVEERLELKRFARAPRMRLLAMAASVLLVLGVAFVGYQIRNPEVVTPPALVATQAAVIQQDAQTIYWRVVLFGDREEIALHVQAAHDLPPGKVHELWVLSAKGGPPVSLGLLPTSGDLKRALTPAQRAALAGATQLAVSLEPSGGSPTGLPTGPVLHVAELAATAA
jgi:anti-sigma-K factor RskA